MNNKRKTISIIIPCFNESENIVPIYERLQKVFKKLSYNYEYIFIDNASTDNSEKYFHTLAKKDKQVKVICMSRNFGSPQPSFIAGLSHMSGDAAVLLQGDIQDPPELIPQFIKAWKDGNAVVYGIRKKRKGTSQFKNLLYRTSYFIIHKLAYISIPPDAGDFSLLDKTVIRHLLQLTEYDYNVRFLRAYVGFQQKGIEYVRDARTKGTSTENIFTGIWWLKSFVINFSLKPLEWISQIAFIVMLVTFILIIINLISIAILRDSPRGIPTVIILILFIGGIQLLCLSVIAEYLAKIFLEVKGRPKYIIRKIINGSPKHKLS